MKEEFADVYEQILQKEEEEEEERIKASTREFPKFNSSNYDFIF